jgi:hypothetical protein
VTDKFHLDVTRLPEPASGAFSSRTRRMTPVFALLLVACSPPPGAATHRPTDAEYAFRWDPAAGGPRTAPAALALLGLSVATPDHYQVRYWDLPAPPSAPAKAVPILRERTKEGGKTEFRLKYRFPAPLAAGWRCPPGAGFRPEEQVDVAVGEGGTAVRVYSYACTLKAAAPPSSLNAAPKSCSVAMTRYGGAGLRAEEWILPDGGRILEISRFSSDSVAELASFRELAARLTASGARPLSRSKTVLGSDCR